MRPVFQSQFGKKKGNCFEACLATLLECDIEDIPVLIDNTGHWASNVDRFLKTKGLCYIEFSIKDKKAGYWILKSGYSILSGQSPRLDCNHAVVAYQAAMVHDPHPSNHGLKTVDKIGFLCLRREKEERCQKKRAWKI